MLCLVEIRGALAQGASLKTDPARRGARLLYEGLKSQYQMIAFSPEDAEITNWWLKKEYMAEWSLIKPWDREQLFSTIRQASASKQSRDEASKN